MGKATWVFATQRALRPWGDVFSDATTCRIFDDEEAHESYTHLSRGYICQQMQQSTAGASEVGCSSGGWPLPSATQMEVLTQRLKCHGHFQLQAGESCSAGECTIQSSVFEADSEAAEPHLLFFWMRWRSNAVTLTPLQLGFRAPESAKDWCPV